jgi:RimJ/RimL family protein N-acetyltransferase
MQVYLETERLVLRRFMVDDAENLFELDGDPEVMRYLSGGEPTPRDMIEEKILPRFLASYERFPGYGTWAAALKSTGEFLGWFGFQPTGEDAPGNVSLGYRLRRTAWGKGYATEGSRALIRKGFTELGAERVYATTYQDNLASRRVMEKVGMKLVRAYRLTLSDLRTESTFYVAGEDVWDGDDVEYAVLKADWEQNAAESSNA